jgi:hypothetical protein
LIVTFRSSVHYDSKIYCSKHVNSIVNLLLRVRQERVFIFLLQGILDLNVDDAESWLVWAKKAINARRDLNSSDPKQAVILLYSLKKQLGSKATDYLSAIVPKYVLRRLEQLFQVKGAVDVYVCIQKEVINRQHTWDSSQRQGSNSVDAAVWNILNQSGACYECKLGTTVKQDQIDLLSCIWHESDRRIEVGIASFASAPSMKKRILNLNVPSFVKTFTRNDIYASW